MRRYELNRKFVGGGARLAPGYFWRRMGSLVPEIWVAVAEKVPFRTSHASQMRQLAFPLTVLTMTLVSVLAFAAPHKPHKAVQREAPKLSDSVGKGEDILEKKLKEIDEFYKRRETLVLDLCNKEIEFLTNKLNFLGSLLTLAGIVAIVVPVYAGLKIHSAWTKSRDALEKANAAVDKASSARLEGLKDKAKLNYVNSKNCFRQYRALSGKITTINHDAEPDTLGSLLLGIEEVRLNFMVQALVCIERAIAYNVESKHNKAVRANLVALALYHRTLQEVDKDNNRDLGWLTKRMHWYKWTCSLEEIKAAFKDSTLTITKKKALIESYAICSSKFGSGNV